MMPIHFQIVGVQNFFQLDPFNFSISYDTCTMDNWNKMQTVQHIHSHQQVEMVHNLSTSSSHNEEAEFRKSAAQIMQV